MDEYIPQWELAASKLKSMNVSHEEETLVTLFFEPFRSRKSQEYANVITVVQTKEVCRWTDVAARKMQEYIPKNHLGNNTLDTSFH